MSDGNKPAFRGVLDSEYPEGFDDRGRRLLAECPEFRLYELFREGGEEYLERSESLEKALKKASFSINDADGTEKRIAWAEALQCLAAMSLGTYHGGLPLLNRLVETIGKEVAEMLTDEKGSPEKAAAAFKSALNSLTRKRFKTERLLILHAEGYFRVFRKRPTKTELIRQMEYLGICFHGKNARADTWPGKFILAGLGDLPD